MFCSVFSIALRVNDLDASVAFYKNVLGATVADTFEREETNARWVFVGWRGSRTKIQLVKDDQPLVAGNAIYYIVLDVPNSDQTAARVLDNGGSIIQESGPHPFVRNLRNAIIADPNGHRIEIVETMNQFRLGGLYEWIPPALLRLIRGARMKASPTP